MQDVRFFFETRDFAELVIIKMVSLRSEYMPPAVEWEFNEMASEVERLRQLNQTLVLENKELRRRVTVLEQFVEVRYTYIFTLYHLH